jgi:hypothetical protein
MRCDNINCKYKPGDIIIGYQTPNDRYLGRYEVIDATKKTVSYKILDCQTEERNGEIIIGKGIEIFDDSDVYYFRLDKSTNLRRLIDEL